MVVVKRKSGPSMESAVAEVRAFVTLAGVSASVELWSTMTFSDAKSLTYMPTEEASPPSILRIFSADTACENATAKAATMVKIRVLSNMN